MAIAEAVTIPDTLLDRIELRSRHRASALSQLLSAAHGRRIIREPEALLATLQRLERLACSALGKQVAVAHAHSLCVLAPWTALGRAKRGIEWDAPDGQPVLLLALVLSPASMAPAAHLERVSAMTHLLRTQRTRQRLLENDDAIELASARAAR